MYQTSDNSIFGSKEEATNHQAVLNEERDRKLWERSAWKDCELRELIEWGRDKEILRTESIKGNVDIVYFSDGSAIKIQILGLAECSCCANLPISVYAIRKAR